MSFRFATLFILLTCALTQITSAQNVTAAEVDVPYSRSLTAGDLHVFTIEVEDDSFVYGFVNQASVDVVVTVRNAADKVLGTFDGPGRGPEHFSFSTKRSGEVRIEVAPFKDAEGAYSLILKRVEPVADDAEGKIEQMMTAYSGDNTPGGAVGVYRNGEVIYTGSWGAANLTHDIPFSRSTRCNIGSVSKQFTAFGIALLAEAGKLSLDDDIRTYIPELPEFTEITRIRNLLTHTGGYREVYNTIPMTGWGFEDELTRDQIIEMLQRQEKLQFDIGTTYTYNNTAFILLSLLIERVTDKPFGEWMNENVFSPLEMNSTGYKTKRGQVIPNAAQGYSPDTDGSYRITGDFDASAGAGGVYTTIDDVGKWVHNFSTQSVGGPDVLKALTSRAVLASGDSIDYGLGIGVTTSRGFTICAHGGADIAHRAHLIIIPDLDAGVFAMGNNSGFQAQVTRKIAELFFEELQNKKEDSDGDKEVGATETKTVTVDTVAFDRVAGRYAFRDVPMEIEYSREGSTLFAQATNQPRVRLLMVSASEYDYEGVPGARVTFHLQAEGSADSATHFQGKDLRLKRIDAYTATAELLSTYEGLYMSAELDVILHCTLKNDTLQLQRARMNDVPLKATGENEFTGDRVYGTVIFEPGTDGVIRGFTVSNARTRTVRFEKLR